MKLLHCIMNENMLWLRSRQSQLHTPSCVSTISFRFFLTACSILYCILQSSVTCTPAAAHADINHLGCTRNHNRCPIVRIIPLTRNAHQGEKGPTVSSINLVARSCSSSNISSLSQDQIISNVSPLCSHESSSKWKHFPSKKLIV